MSRPGRPNLLLFHLPVVCLISLPLVLYAQSDPCVAANYDSQVKVQHVIDGDTVVLADGRRLRLVGIDTPELGNDKHPAEQWAVPARSYLENLLKTSGTALFVVYDQERHDDYGRQLAHLFLPEGDNVQALVLQQGLASPLTIPPNVGFLDCYRRHARTAQKAGLRLWATPRYQPRMATALTGAERGYHVVQGRITRIGDSQTSFWINLGEGFALRIVKADLEYFADLEISRLKGNTVQASGDIYRQNRQLRMRIRHPADMLIMSD